METKSADIHRYRDTQFSRTYTEYNKTGFIHIKNNDDGNEIYESVQVFANVIVHLTKDGRVVTVEVKNADTGNS